MGLQVIAFLRRWYFAFALGLFVLSPGVRRFVDWQTSFHKLSLFSILPLMAMLPGVALMVVEWKNLRPLYRALCVTWLAALAPAFLVGVVSGSPASAGYDLLMFATPLLFGAFLASANEDATILFDRVAGAILFFGAATSLYAIYQYVSPPAWDAYWVANADIPSIGVPVPFGLRVFGTLNAYATLAHFTALAMILNLPRVRARNWMTVIAYVPCAIALLLTSDRTAWLAFAGGMLVYLIASPRRRSVFIALPLAAAMCAAVSGLLLFSLQGSDDVISQMQLRFASLADIGDDSSFADRLLQTTQALREGATEPLGQGLGSVGTAAIAGAAATTNTLDNGYLARFVELGVAGFAAYVLALAVALFAVLRTYRANLRVADSAVASILATALAVQVMMLGLDLSTDTHNGLLGLFFWFSLYVASRYQAATPVAALTANDRPGRRVLLDFQGAGADL